jgi:outer membrane cobalamin receptor
MIRHPSRRSAAVRLGIALLLAACPAAAAIGEPAGPGGPAPPDLTSLSLQELLNIDLVYGASKYEQKVTEAPASVTIVTAADIRNFGYNTLSDILASVPGFYSRYDRDYSYVGVRGFERTNDYNLRTLLLIDGHRANDNIYNSALVGTEGVLNVDDIDRVEVIRGPSSSIYGTGAFFAVINVITRSGRELNGTEVSGAGGSWDTGAARISWGGKKGDGPEVFVEGSAYHSGGQDFTFPEFNDPGNPLSANQGRAVGVDGDDAYRFFGKASVGRFTVEAAHSSREKVIPTAPYGTLFNDPDNKTTDQRSFLDLKYDGALGEKTSLLGRVYADRYYYRGDYDYPPPGGQYVEKAYGYTSGLEAQFTARPDDKNTLLAGGEFRDHWRQDFYARDTLGSYFNEHRSSDDWALFIQDQFVPSKRLLLNAGARYDRYRSFGGSTNPRIAVIYTPIDRTTLKFLYGRAFRAPSAQELYYGAGANPDLGPETIHTAEFVLEQYVGHGLRISGTYFRNRVDNLISFDTTTLLFENAMTIDSDGSEVGLEQHWDNGAAVRVDYALQDTRVRATGEHLGNSPRHLAKFHLTLPILGEKLSAGAEVQYTGDRVTLLGNEVGGYTVVNLTLLSRHLARGLDLSGSIYNLLDKAYEDPGGSGNLQDALAQDGRHFRIKLTWSF